MHQPPRCMSVVIGGTIDALQYAWDNSLPVVCCKQKPPVGYGASTLSDTKRWEWLCFNLSLAGLIPFSDKASSIRITDEGVSIVAGTKSYRVVSDNIIVFDDDGVAGLPDPVGKTSDVYEVFDWMNVRSGMTHEHERLDSTSDFVKWIYFYPSERIDGNHNKKDLVSISYMSEGQLQDPKYSEIYAKFKVLYMMREAGIKGQSAGVGKNYSIKVEPTLREVRWAGKNEYKDTERIKFL